MYISVEQISTLDEFLDNIWLFIFYNDNDLKAFIFSADWMKRNIENRVMVKCPINYEDIKREHMETLEICWSDYYLSKLEAEL